MTTPTVAALLAASVSTLALAGAGHAQQADEGSAAPILLAGIDTITVTATRNPIEAFSYPGSVTVIDRAAIEDLSASSISDLFEAVPGVKFDGGPRRTGEVPSVRGLEGEGVVILFDGVRQSFLSGHDGRFFIEPDLLKSAEIVRGPGSALYGSGAVGGVIAFRTLDAGDILKGEETVALRVGGGFQGVNDEWMGTGAVFARSENGRFDGVASLTYRDAGDIDLGDDTVLEADDSVLSGLAKGTMQITDALKAQVTYLTYRAEAREPNNGQGVNSGDLVDKDITNDTVRIGLNYAPRDNRWIDAGLIAYYNAGEVEEAEVGTTRVITRDVETFGVVGDNRSRFAIGTAGEITLTYGGEYYQDEQIGRDNETADGTRGGVPDATADTYGLFVQAEIALDTEIGEFLLIPAVRYDHFKNEAVGVAQTTDEGATSPKVGLSYKPVPWLLTFANYAQAFRAPSFNEIFADDIHFQIPLGPGVSAPNFFIPNPDLRPEESDTWEVGGGVDFTGVFGDNDRFIAKGSYYQSDVDDLIDLEVNFEFAPACFSPMIPGPCTSGASRNVNTSNARLEGYEIEAQYDAARFFATAGYSSIDGEDRDTGEFVGILTPDRLNLTAGVKLPEIDSRLGVRAEIAAEFDKVDAPAEIRPSYEVFDVYFVWAPGAGALEGLRLDLAIDNIADEDFERVFAGVAEPGRNFKAAARWTQRF